MEADEQLTIEAQLAAAMERQAELEADAAGTADSPSVAGDDEPNTGS